MLEELTEGRCGTADSSATAGSSLEVRERALARRAAVLGASGTDSIAASSTTTASAFEVRDRALARRAAVLGASETDALALASFGACAKDKKLPAGSSAKSGTSSN